MFLARRKTVPIFLIRVFESFLDLFKSKFFWIYLVITLIGFLAQLSAARGNFDSWAAKHLLFSVSGILVASVIAAIKDYTIKKSAYLSYFIALISLIFVALAGKTVMGAKRWLTVFDFSVQPSEFAKSAIILTLAKKISSEKKSELSVFTSFFIVLPVFLLIFFQPNLGTSLSIFFVFLCMEFASGFSARIKYILVTNIVIVFLLSWNFILLPYQKARIYAFLHPSADPLGDGYNVIQSKIAIGSGGLFGTGFLKGSQTQLDFIPEKRTDFVFAVFAEEFGAIGSCILLFACLLFILMGVRTSIKCRSSFPKLYSFGISSLFFFHVAVNVGMNLGAAPVTGIPLLGVSYGGSSLLNFAVCLGLLINAERKNAEPPDIRGSKI